jgi:hypothetical protein
MVHGTTPYVDGGLTSTRHDPARTVGRSTDGPHGVLPHARDPAAAARPWSPSEEPVAVERERLRT